jgi:hypothetical protein
MNAAVAFLGIVAVLALAWWAFFLNPLGACVP